MTNYGEGNYKNDIEGIIDAAKMKKFYVVSGNIRILVLGPTPFQACVQAFALANLKNIEPDPYLMYVDERGYRIESSQHKIQTDVVIDWMLHRGFLEED